MKTHRLVLDWQITPKTSNGRCVQRCNAWDYEVICSSLDPVYQGPPSLLSCILLWQLIPQSLFSYSYLATLPLVIVSVALAPPHSRPSLQPASSLRSVGSLSKLIRNPPISPPRNQSHSPSPPYQLAHFPLIPPSQSCFSPGPNSSHLIDECPRHRWIEYMI